jgi:hypothetical protein
MIGIRWYKLRDGKSREYFFFDMKMKEKMNPGVGVPNEMKLETTK